MKVANGEPLSGIDEVVLNYLVEVEEIDAALRAIEYAVRIANPHAHDGPLSESIEMLRGRLWHRRSSTLEQVMALGHFTASHKLREKVKKLAFKKLLHPNGNRDNGTNDGKLRLELGWYLDRNNRCDCHSEGDIAREIEAVGIALGFDCQGRNREERALALLKLEPTK